MTVCIGFKDLENNGYLVADSSRSLGEELIDTGHKKIIDVTLYKKTNLLSLFRLRKRKIGLAFAGDSEVIDAIISDFNIAKVKSFEMKDCFRIIANKLHDQYQQSFHHLSKDLQILFMGYCDKEDKVSVYQGKIILSKTFDESWICKEFCLPGMGPGQIGFGLSYSCLDSKTLESICKCFIERKKSQPTVSLPLTHGKLSNTGKDFEYLGEYTCE
jgi:hypothetical protein